MEVNMEFCVHEGVMGERGPKGMGPPGRAERGDLWTQKLLY